MVGVVLGTRDNRWRLHRFQEERTGALRTAELTRSQRAKPGEALVRLQHRQLDQAVFDLAKREPLAG